MKVKSWKLTQVEVEPWLKTRFGDHYAQISTDTTLKLKSSAKDVARVRYGQVPEEIEELTKKFQMPPQGISDLDFVFGYKAGDDWVEGSVESDNALQTYIARYSNDWEIVQKLLGIPRSKGRHACAFVIADRPIKEFIPLAKVGGVTCTQYTAASVEAAGGVKMDFLVVNSLGDIRDAIGLIQRRFKGQVPDSLVLDGRLVPKHRLIPLPNVDHTLPPEQVFADVWSLPEDQNVFREVAEGKTESVFQFNTPGAVQWLAHFNHWKDGERKAIDSIEAMSAFTALDRPGPLDAYVETADGRRHNMLVEYARRARGETPHGSHPVFMELFPETYGVLTYQEQLQRAYRELTGCTGAEAEEFRTNVAKKKMDKVLKAYPSWMERVGAKIGEESAKAIWDTFVTWGQYGFNKTMLQSTILVSGSGERKRLMDFKAGETIRCVGEDGHETTTEVVALHDHGEMMGWEVEFDDGYTVVASSHHKFLTPEGQKPLHEIVDRDLEVLCGVSMEEETGRGTDGLRAKGAQAGPGCAQEGVRDLRLCEGREHSTANAPTQHSPRAESSGICGRDQDVCSTGRPTCACGEDPCLAKGAPRADRGDLGVCSTGCQAVQDGDVASVHGGIDLGGCPYSLRRQAEAGGLCVAGPQDLGGSGRFLPLLRAIEGSPAALQGAGEGCDAKGRVSSPRRRDIDPAFRTMLPFFRRENASAVAPVAYSDAPLASTGSLVRRRIVRVRSVGLVRMCDLEVAHPKHNFLLPNGVVTSNSHSVCYVHISYACSYLKHHYPLEWWCAVLRNASKNEVSETFWRHIHTFVDLPDVNSGADNFTIINERIKAPIALINGVGPTAHKQLMEGAPYRDIADFCERIQSRRIAEKKPTIDKATGKQKQTKKGELCWTLGRSALTRGVIHRLIAAGVMDPLFPQGADVADKVFAFEAAYAASRGEKKVQPVPEVFTSYSPVRNFQMRKAILPIYSEPLLPLLLEGPANWPRTALKQDGARHLFAHNNDYIPVISAQRMARLDNVTPWPEGLRVTVAVPAYVLGREVFRWGPKKAKEALKLQLELEGGRSGEFVKWGDRKTGLLDARYKGKVEGGLILALFTKYTENKPFSLDDFVVFHEPPNLKEDDDDKEDSKDPSPRQPVLPLGASAS